MEGLRVVLLILWDKDEMLLTTSVVVFDLMKIGYILELKNHSRTNVTIATPNVLLLVICNATRTQGRDYLIATNAKKLSHRRKNWRCITKFT